MTVLPAGFADLLGQDRSPDLYERPAGETEVGGSARAAAGAAIAVLRGGEVLALDDPRPTRLFRSWGQPLGARGERVSFSRVDACLAFSMVRSVRELA